MKWIKKGLIFKPTGEYEWLQTHASTPIALHLEDDMYRIYFGSRNQNNFTQLGYIEIDITRPNKITKISEKPVLEVGKLGMFDDAGIFCTSLVKFKQKLFLYYAGWMRGVTVPYYAALGLAISEDGGKSFKRYSEAPIMDRNHLDPLITPAPDVMKVNNVWRMWYPSAVDFKIITGKPMYYYHIKYAESRDGVHWKREGHICIDFKYESETRIARPCVLKDDDCYRMWYSYAIGFNGYRIGYAISTDGLKWERKDDEVGIDVSKSGWDSEMICYAYVFDHLGQKYMLYNGNSYGKTGFGIASLTN